MDVGLISSSSNPVVDVPARMRISYKDTDQEEDVPPLQQLSKATGQTEEQLVALDDEDLRMLMQEAGFLGVATKNAVLLEVTKLRNTPPVTPVVAVGDDGGGDGGDDCGGGLDVDLQPAMRGDATSGALKLQVCDVAHHWIRRFVLYHSALAM